MHLFLLSLDVRNMDAILFLFVLFLTGLSESSGCPKNENLAPCKCHKDLFGNAVQCQNILNSEELIPPLQALANSRTKLYHLAIEKSFLMYLPENIFQNNRIEWVEFKDSQIMSLSESDTAFDGLEGTLMRLQAYNISTASDWDFSQLRNLVKLKYIFLEHVSLGSIDPPFPYLPNLATLKINSAEISYVSDNAFSNLPNLFEFYMENNDVKELKRNIFPNPANKLFFLYLRRNKLSYLPKDFFDNMPSLSNVHLDKNKFTTLTEMPFSIALRNFYELSMSENPFRCDCRMRWLVNTRFPYVFKGVCSTPAVLSGRNIEDLDLKLLWC